MLARASTRAHTAIQCYFVESPHPGSDDSEQDSFSSDEAE